jgi:hypothetical protein
LVAILSRLLVPSEFLIFCTVGVSPSKSSARRVAASGAMSISFCGRVPTDEMNAGFCPVRPDVDGELSGIFMGREVDMNK